MYQCLLLCSAEATVQLFTAVAEISLLVLALDIQDDLPGYLCLILAHLPETHQSAECYRNSDSHDPYVSQIVHTF